MDIFSNQLGNQNSNDFILSLRQATMLEVEGYKAAKAHDPAVGNFDVATYVLPKIPASEIQYMVKHLKTMTKDRKEWFI